MSSAASSRSRRDAERLAALVFFIDRSLGGRVIAEALRAAGAQVEIHDAHFAPDAPDVEWLATVGKQGWVVLSKDARIRRDAFEREALRSASVKAFFLTQQGSRAKRWPGSLSPPYRAWSQGRVASRGRSSTPSREKVCLPA
jgi:hypothetical protein